MAADARNMAPYIRVIARLCARSTPETQAETIEKIAVEAKLALKAGGFKE